MELQKPHSESELLQSSGTPSLEGEDTLPSSSSPPKNGCLRCVTPKKCSVWGCCPGTFPSESPNGESPTQGMSLPERILYVGGAGYGEFGSVQADHVLLITRTVA